MNVLCNAYLQYSTGGCSMQRSGRGSKNVNATSVTAVTQNRLRDGRMLTIRAIRSEDKTVLVDIMEHLSAHSIYMRFLGPRKELTKEELVYYTEVDSFHHVALVASVLENGAQIPVGIARYIMSDDSAGKEAEMAFAIEDAYQGMGIGTLILKHLSKIAREAGIAVLTALVLPENVEMLRVFAKSGLPLETTTNAVGVIEIKLTVSQ